MYTTINFKTKKALKEAIAAGQEITVYQSNNIFNVQIPQAGTVYLEGPHYPQAHTWYAKATLENGLVVKVV